MSFSNVGQVKEVGFWRLSQSFERVPGKKLTIKLLDKDRRYTSPMRIQTKANSIGLESRIYS